MKVSRRSSVVAALGLCLGITVAFVQVRWVTSFGGLLVYGGLLCLLSSLFALLLSRRSRRRFVLLSLIFSTMVAWSFIGSSPLLGIAIYRIASPSMEPAIGEGSLIIVEQNRSHESALFRCDVIAFNHQGAVYVKRVVGLPLDRVEVRAGKLLVNSHESDCPAKGNSLSTFRKVPTVVPEHHLFVLGDNHRRSEDSRIFGPVPEDLVLGVVTDVMN